MTAEIVDLARWREDHPPLVMLWQAQQRCLAAWWSLMIRINRF